MVMAVITLNVVTLILNSGHVYDGRRTRGTVVF